MDASDAYLAGNDGRVLAALALPGRDVFGRGLEILELPPEEGEAVR